MQLVHLLNKLTVLRLRTVFEVMRVWDGGEKKLTFRTGCEKGTHVIPRTLWPSQSSSQGINSSPQKICGEAGVQRLHTYEM